MKKVPDKLEIKRLSLIIKHQDKEIRRLRNVIDEYSWVMDWIDTLKHKIKEQTSESGE